MEHQQGVQTTSFGISARTRRLRRDAAVPRDGRELGPRQIFPRERRESSVGGESPRGEDLASRIHRRAVLRGGDRGGTVPRRPGRDRRQTRRRLRHDRPGVRHRVDEKIGGCASTTDPRRGHVHHPGAGLRGDGEDLLLPRQGGTCRTPFPTTRTTTRTGRGGARDARGASRAQTTTAPPRRSSYGCSRTRAPNRRATSRRACPSTSSRASQTPPPPEGRTKRSKTAPSETPNAFSSSPGRSRASRPRARTFPPRNSPKAPPPPSAR